MDTITIDQVADLFEAVAAVFADKKDELCAMDAAMGDGDLGLTMSKGYAALPELIRANKEPNDMGKTLMKAGMKMASIVPSTMGTLMASGIMEGGKALKGAHCIGPVELALYFTSFAEGIQKRGKCVAGDRTVLDAVNEAAAHARIAAALDGATLSSVMDASVEGAREGSKKTEQMLPKFGKAAVFADKAIGTADQGAIAGLYMMIGMQNYIANGS